MDPYAPPVIPDEPEPTLESIEVDVEPQVEDNAEPEPQEDSDPLTARLKALEQRIGTDDDVRKVKSQRDQLKNELDQLKPAVEQLQAQVMQTVAQRARDEDAAFETAWAQHIRSQPDQAHVSLAQQQYNAMKTQRDADRRAAVIDQRERQLVSQEQESSAQQMVQGVQALYSSLAQSAGVDPSKLDMSSAGNLQKSFQAEIAKAQRLGQNPPPKPGHAPQRGGAPAPAKTVMNWFDDAVASGDFKRINAAFKAASEHQGLTVDDIVRR